LGGGEGIGVRGRGDHAPTLQADKLTTVIGGKCEGGGDESWDGGGGGGATMLLGAGEAKLIFWALIWKEKGNIHIAYDCIQIVTISPVGECAE
jgi:hypothetical protein